MTVLVEKPMVPTTSPAPVNPSPAYAGTSTNSTLVIKGVTARSRQIKRLLWASVVLSICALAIDLSFFGDLSFWITPIATLFTLIHHTILLVHIRKERKADPPAYDELEANPHKLKMRTGNSLTGATTKMASIVCAGLCVVLWLASWAALVANFVLSLSPSTSSRSASLSSNKGVVSGISALEWVFVLAEVVVLATLAIKCMKERSLVMRGANWYQLNN